MNNEAILSRVDHTLLRADASWTEIQALCGEAIAYRTASVCIPPAYVRPIREAYGDQLNICTVLGFPLGYSVLAAKLAEAETALREGAGELDMVINLGQVKNGELDRVAEEIAAVKRTAGEAVVKVIVETCYLTEGEKASLCAVVTQAGADYIKTSTGFGTAGATLADVRLFKEKIGPGVKIKAAGGIRSREDMVAYIEAGCDRLGTSSAVKLLTGGRAGAY